MKRKKWTIPLAALGLLCVVGLLIVFLLPESPKELNYGFHRSVPAEEEALRLRVVSAAEKWLGCKESDGSHRSIIDLYNNHPPLARGYAVQYTDNWCATFVSAVAIEENLTHIIPTECGCQRQIQLFQEMDCWVEDDAYIPLPGDIIYYCTKYKGTDDCKDWSDHVGIVIGTDDDYIKVIEGNLHDAVSYRYIKVDAPTIRGYAVPAYGQTP